jgi:integrase
VQKPWSLDESLSVLKAAPSDDQMDCFIHLMLLTGLRPGEALGLRWCDIDLEKNMLHVTGTLRVDRRIMPNGDGVTRLTRNDPKTKASNRSLPLHPDLREALERQQMRQSLWRTLAGPKWIDSGYVICTSVGTPKDPNNNRQKFYQFLERIDVRRIRQHDMRHVVAIRALEGDVRLEDVSQALGHTRLDTTKQIYAGNVPRLNDRFIQGLGDLFSVRSRIEIPQPSPTDDI